jgi:hypothetical protein
VRLGRRHPAVLFTGITYIAGGCIFAMALPRQRPCPVGRSTPQSWRPPTIAVGLVPQYELERRVRSLKIQSEVVDVNARGFPAGGMADEERGRPPRQC